MRKKEYLFKTTVIVSVMLNRDGTINAEVLNNREHTFNSISESNDTLSFGDKTLFRSLAIEPSLVKGVGIAFGNFITEHIKENLNISNPLIAEVDLHLETNSYRGVFDVALTESSLVNIHHTEQDKMIMLRAFYHFDEIFREMNGLQQVPREIKQQKYDEHISGLNVPYMRADNVPDLEDRTPDSTIEFVEITNIDDENLQGRPSQQRISKILENKAVEDGVMAIETIEQPRFNVFANALDRSRRIFSYSHSLENDENS